MPNELEQSLALLGNWSEWTPFKEAILAAPRRPGVYLAREGEGGPIIYVGMAGERAGLSRAAQPKGLRGRLAVYASGKALTSGLGEAVADRAFGDASWIRARLAEAEAGTPRRAKAWGIAAFERANLYIRWCETGDKAGALVLEAKCGQLLGATVWNRRKWSLDS